MKLHIPTLLRAAAIYNIRLYNNGEFIRYRWPRDMPDKEMWRVLLKRHKRELLPHLPAVELPM